MASEYNWSKADILEKVYFDEFLDYQDFIKRRSLFEYRMQLAIVQNPHITDDEDRSKLWQLLNEAEDTEGRTYLEEEAQLDIGSFNQLKLAMSDNPHIIIKA